MIRVDREEPDWQQDTPRPLPDGHVAHLLRIDVHDQVVDDTELLPTGADERPAAHVGLVARDAEPTQRAEWLEAAVEATPQVTRDRVRSRIEASVIERRVRVVTLAVEELAVRAHQCMLVLLVDGSVRRVGRDRGELLEEGRAQPQLIGGREVLGPHRRGYSLHVGFLRSHLPQAQTSVSDGHEHVTVAVRQRDIDVPDQTGTRIGECAPDCADPDPTCVTYRNAGQIADQAERECPRSARIVCDSAHREVRVMQPLFLDTSRGFATLRAAYGRCRPHIPRAEAECVTDTMYRQESSSSTVTKTVAVSFSCFHGLRSALSGSSRREASTRASPSRRPRCASCTRRPA